MRCFVLLTFLACLLALARSAAIEQAEESQNAPIGLLDVDVGVENVGESARQARQFFGGGYYGRPYGGFYGRPYGGFYGRPYGGYYGRPYGGFYGRPYGGFYG